MKIIAAKNFVICTEPKTSNMVGGIETTYSKSNNKPEIGIVYAIGKGVLPIPMKVGDKIAYRKYSDNRIFVDKQHFNFIKFEDVCGVVKEGK